MKHCESRNQIPDKTIFGYYGTVAQLVEQWTENPCVTGSTPVGTTKKIREVAKLVKAAVSKKKLTCLKVMFSIKTTLGTAICWFDSSPLDKN